MSKLRKQYYDEHTLYVTSGVAKEDQIVKCLKESIRQLEEKTGKKYKCWVKVNLIVDKNGGYFGFGYIRISNPEIYWMLLGRNPDGTERSREYPDPDWVPPLPKPKTRSSEKKSWSEMMEDDDMYIHPIIREELAPLMTVPGYKYDQFQREHLKTLAEKDVGGEVISIPEMGYFEISRAYAHKPDGKAHNILRAQKVPSWIPERIFKNVFSPYATDNKNKFPRKVGNTKIKDSYPFITILDGKDNSKIVLVEYDPSTQDGMFALLMTRKVRIKHPTNKSLKCTIIFNHAYESRSRRPQTKSNYTRDR